MLLMRIFHEKVWTPGLEDGYDIGSAATLLEEIHTIQTLRVGPTVLWNQPSSKLMKLYFSP